MTSAINTNKNRINILANDKIFLNLPQSEKSLAIFFLGRDKGILSTQLYTSCISSSLIYGITACSTFIGFANAYAGFSVGARI